MNWFYWIVFWGLVVQSPSAPVDTGDTDFWNGGHEERMGNALAYVNDGYNNDNPPHPQHMADQPQLPSSESGGEEKSPPFDPNVDSSNPELSSDEHDLSFQDTGEMENVKSLENNAAQLKDNEGEKKDEEPQLMPNHEQQQQEHAEVNSETGTEEHLSMSGGDQLQKDEPEIENPRADDVGSLQGSLDEQKNLQDEKMNDGQILEIEPNPGPDSDNGNPPLGIPSDVEGNGFENSETEPFERKQNSDQEEKSLQQQDEEESQVFDQSEKPKPQLDEGSQDPVQLEDPSFQRNHESQDPDQKEKLDPQQGEESQNPAQLANPDSQQGERNQNPVQLENLDSQQDPDQKEKLEPQPGEGNQNPAQLESPDSQQGDENQDPAQKEKLNPEQGEESQNPVQLDNPDSQQGEGNQNPDQLENPDSQQGEGNQNPVQLENPDSQQGEKSQNPVQLENPDSQQGEGNQDPDQKEKLESQQDEGNQNPVQLANPDSQQGEVSQDSGQKERLDPQQGEESQDPVQAETPDSHVDGGSPNTDQIKDPQLEQDEGIHNLVQIEKPSAQQDEGNQNPNQSEKPEPHKDEGHRNLLLEPVPEANSSFPQPILKPETSELSNSEIGGLNLEGTEVKEEAKFTNDSNDREVEVNVRNLGGDIRTIPTMEDDEMNEGDDIIQSPVAPSVGSKNISSGMFYDISDTDAVATDLNQRNKEADGVLDVAGPTSSSEGEGPKHAADIDEPFNQGMDVPALPQPLSAGRIDPVPAINPTNSACPEYNADNSKETSEALERIVESLEKITVYLGKIPGYPDKISDSLEKISEILGKVVSVPVKITENPKRTTEGPKHKQVPEKATENRFHPGKGSSFEETEYEYDDKPQQHDEGCKKDHGALVSIRGDNYRVIFDKNVNDHQRKYSGPERTFMPIDLIDPNLIRDNTSRFKGHSYIGPYYDPTHGYYGLVLHGFTKPGMGESFIQAEQGGAGKTRKSTRKTGESCEDPE